MQITPWEYTILRSVSSQGATQWVTDGAHQRVWDGDNSLATVLGDLGAAGWELVCLAEDGQYVLKSPIP